MQKYYYCLSLLFVFVIPTAIAGVLLRNDIPWTALVPFIVLVTIIGSIWDVWATRHGRKDRIWLWQFNRRQTIGIRILGLPIEEYIFYVASSVYVIFMWQGFQLMIRNSVEAYLIVGSLAVWTLISIAVPYLFRKRGDKLIG